jgi:flagellar assembly factor FliW
MNRMVWRAESVTPIVLLARQRSNVRRWSNDGALLQHARNPRGTAVAPTFAWRQTAMRVNTTRFGRLEVEADDVLLFSNGVLGLEDCRHWVLLADAENDALGWLQSVSRSEIALAVVSPRRFVPDYQLRVARCEINPLELENLDQAQVLLILGKNQYGVTLNLKAPIVINIDRRLGRQVIANGEQPVQYQLTDGTSALRKSA